MGLVEGRKGCTPGDPPLPLEIPCSGISLAHWGALGTRPSIVVNFAAFEIVNLDSLKKGFIGGSMSMNKPNQQLRRDLTGSASDLK